MRWISGLLCVVAMAGVTAQAQSSNDMDALRALPGVFRDAFNKHDGHALAKMMAVDVDFVTVGLTWFHGRADFEKYHARLLEGRFKEVVYTVLDTHVRVVGPTVAVVRHSWRIEGDRNADGSSRVPRLGLMTMIAEKQDGTWLITAAHNGNAPTDGPERSPEALDIKSPIVVPRAIK